MAERARFELAVPCGTLAFQASALDRYATSPRGMVRREDRIGISLEGQGVRMLWFDYYSLRFTLCQIALRTSRSMPTIQSEPLIFIPRYLGGRSRNGKADRWNTGW